MAKNKATHIFHYVSCRFLLLLFIAGCACRPLYAQDTIIPNANIIKPDSTQRPAARKDSVIVTGLFKNPHSPRKAAFFSAVVPGLGQAYNREYWKIPLVYAAMGISAGFFVGNFNYYKDYRDAYRIRMDGNANTHDKYEGIYNNAESLKVLRDAYRQYVDYSVLVFVLAYGLNIIDATVFAHLRDWNMSDDLSMRITPAVLDNRALGLSLKIDLGKVRGKNKAGWVLGR
ncbi:MAG TPA: DUF5683 domain-containing protein [Chitinophaga sp.]|uniref:DUF5683 domain-containing protein n=1 Tax=Chitinophaga sp. TaxID=1869181 RepID=UPI002DBFE0AD|nr:DUF5683 domain-containing protein [Chitinophaga sp.]HEU4553539.1 DUF5683 domain-containing protein [Chitinophaga sp.]